MALRIRIVSYVSITITTLPQHLNILLLKFSVVFHQRAPLIHKPLIRSLKTIVRLAQTVISSFFCVKTFQKHPFLTSSFTAHLLKEWSCKITKHYLTFLTIQYLIPASLPVLRLIGALKCNTKRNVTRNFFVLLLHFLRIHKILFVLTRKVLFELKIIACILDPHLNILLFIHFSYTNFILFKFKLHQGYPHQLRKVFTNHMESSNPLEKD